MLLPSIAAAMSSQKSYPFCDALEGLLKVQPVMAGISQSAEAQRPWESAAWDNDGHSKLTVMMHQLCELSALLYREIGAGI